MLKIRFTRVGKKNAPSFRLVLIPKEKAPKGKSLEVLGFYNPITKEKDVKKDRIAHWLAVGAQTSDSAHNFLIKMGVIKGKKIAVHAKSKKKEEETAAVGVVANAPKEAPKAEAPKAEMKTEVKKEEVKTEPVVPAVEVPAAPSVAKEEPVAPVAEKTEALAKAEAAVAESVPIADKPAETETPAASAAATSPQEAVPSEPVAVPVEPEKAS